MPKLKDIISDQSKKNLMKIDDSGYVRPLNFAGETPNLNSSLGVNAFAEPRENFAGVHENFGPCQFVGAKENFGGVMENATGDIDPSTTTDQSKLSQFWSKNSSLITGIGSAIFGGGSQVPSGPSSGASATPSDDKKKGMPVWAWILIVVAVIAIIVLIVRAAKK